MATGRPRKDTIDTHKLILALAKSGANNTQIAEITGLSRVTIQSYLGETDLGRSVKAVRDAAALLDAKNKAALNKSALQATRRLIRKHKTTETITRTDERGALLYTETRTRETDPNAGMVQFVLRNTDAANWTENPQAQPDAGQEDNELRIILDE